MRTLNEVGERKLIDVIMRRLTPMPRTPMPFWDDVSAVAIDQGKIAILKTDMLVWKTDVPQGMTPFQAARKAVVMNFSDLGSKGVQPAAFLVSIGLPRGLTVDFVNEMAMGFDAGVREYDAYVIGGDTGEAGEVIISGVAFGVADEKLIMKREGARPGDILATTGSFGNTAAAFKILLEGYEAPQDLRASLLGSVYMPRARVKEGAALARSGAISASMDSSDGLAMSLHDLSRSSGVGFIVERLPVSPEAARFAEMHDLDLGELVFYGGEEYELVLTIRPEAMGSARAALRGVGCELVEIGRATGEKRIVYHDSVMDKPLRSGYEHFR